jgi:hypothetical protein
MNGCALLVHMKHRRLAEVGALDTFVVADSG